MPPVYVCPDCGRQIANPDSCAMVACSVCQIIRAADTLQVASSGPASKLSLLQAAAAAGDWPEAIRIAAKFQRLGDARAAVLDGHMALTRPDWCRQLRKDPAKLIEAAKAALVQQYSLQPPHSA